jgi:DNA-binding transcriptional ArsR family regulator
MQSYGCISSSLMNVFTAVADPTRRSILERLRGEGALSLTSLAERLPISRQAVTKHLDVLEKAGLLRKRVQGRERLHELDAQPLRQVDDWLKPYSAAWDDRLERLRIHLDGDRDGNHA